MELISKMQIYFEYPFVRYALIVAILIALCSSLLGVTLVLKRYSYIGDGLSHVAFGVMAVASILNITNQTLLILPVTLSVAVLLLKTGDTIKIKGDAAIAMLSVGSLAVGYLLLNVFSTSANVSGDVCTTLFGSTSILTLTKEQVGLCILLSIVVIVLFIGFYHRIFAVTFDESFVRATGMPAENYNFLMAILISLVVVLGMNLVGSLLISALIIFPALSAMRLICTFKGVVICSAVFSVGCAIVGVMSAVLFSTPVGSTIVVANMVVFLISYIVGEVRRR